MSMKILSLIDESLLLLEGWPAPFKQVLLELQRQFPGWKVEREGEKDDKRGLFVIRHPSLHDNYVNVRWFSGNLIEASLYYDDLEMKAEKAIFNAQLSKERKQFLQIIKSAMDSIIKTPFKYSLRASWI